MKKKNWLKRLALLALVPLSLLVALMVAPSHSQAASTNQTLIIYFSQTGTTKGAAKQIQKDTGADIVRIRPATPYPKGYNNLVRVANQERQNNIHPAIQQNIPNLSQYKTVLIGFPTWWQRPPMVIHTLFDDYDFQGKTIIPFTTSMSTPMSKSMPTMRQLGNADGATIKNGFRYDNNNAALLRFLKKDGLLKN